MFCYTRSLQSYIWCFNSEWPWLSSIFWLQPFCTVHSHASLCLVPQSCYVKYNYISVPHISGASIMLHITPLESLESLMSQSCYISCIATLESYESLGSWSCYTTHRTLWLSLMKLGRHGSIRIVIIYHLSLHHSMMLFHFWLGQFHLKNICCNFLKAHGYLPGNKNMNRFRRKSKLKNSTY